VANPKLSFSAIYFLQAFTTFDFNTFLIIAQHSFTRGAPEPNQVFQVTRRGIPLIYCLPASRSQSATASEALPEIYFSLSCRRRYTTFLSFSDQSIYSRIY